jgi:hypothetical protein
VGKPLTANVAFPLSHTLSHTLSLTHSHTQAGPVLVGAAAFGTYSAMGKPLTANVAFPALALFNLLRFPM